MDLVRRLLRLSAQTETALRESPYPYVYVDGDGTARELRADEPTYLETDFDGADGARPYVKSNYKQRDGRGRAERLPPTIRAACTHPINPAPSEYPSKPMRRVEYIEDLGTKG